MADIFISYSREDRPRVEPLAEALVSAGYSVWWDRNLAGGSRYLNETETELKAAKAVLVVWTKTSVASHWVADEAGVGRDTGRMLPISLDDTLPPLGFRQFQVIDFSRWKPGHEEQFAELRSALGRLMTLPGAATSPAVKPSSKPLLKRPAVFGGLAVAGIAVVLAVIAIAMRPQTGQATAALSTQRIAFFGFDTASDDAAAKALVEAATDQMFQTLGLVKLNTVARTETKGTPVDKRFARAAELGGLYVLSGEARPDKEGITFSVRFEDVPSRTTLWENSFSAPSPDTGFLPAQAAAVTIESLRCFVRYRARLTQDTSQLLKLVADRCRQGGIGDANSLGVIAASRELARAQPNSAFMHAYVAITLAISISSTPTAARPARIAEAEVELKRASELDPNEPYVLMARTYVAEVAARSLADYGSILLDAQAKADGKDTYVLGYIYLNYARLLRQAGRWRDSLPYQLQGVAYEPMQRGARGMIYAALGQSSVARAEYEQMFASYPFATAWTESIFGAIFQDAGDAEAMLKSPPSFISRSVADCYRDIWRAYVSKDSKARNLGARRVKGCVDAGDLAPYWAANALAALGDLDGAFALVGQREKLEVFSFRVNPIAGLFYPTSRAMRADPRFLPLVEKLGLMEYWRATRSQPDSCETEDVPFCRELRLTPKP